MAIGEAHLYNWPVGLAEVLSSERVSVSNDVEGRVRDKDEALARLSTMLASATEGAGPSMARILEVLTARETLQSTGVGGGVAIPHGAMEDLDRQIAALLVCPAPIPFEAIDGEPVSILFALVGPKGAPAEHLKILARMSRLLRKPAFRQRLASSARGADAYALIVEAEQSDSRGDR